MTIAGIILAAGQGKRLGGVKPLLTHETASLIEIVIAHFRAAKLENLVLVLGHDARRVIQKLTRGGLNVIINPTPSLGMSSSLQRGLARLPTRCDGIMIALGDMPLVTTKTIDTLIAAFDKTNKGIVVPVHKKERGHPVILDREKYLDALLELRGDVGAKAILEANPKDIHEVKIDSDEVILDVDTRMDWDAIKDRLELPRMINSFA